MQRLTAPNPGFMTGPGTNSYVVGDPASGHIVIDPGPDDPGHIERLWRAAGGDIRAIVCTHSHPDHSPGAPRLQALCAQAGSPPPPILGLPSATTARTNSHFMPERTLADGERIELVGATGEAEIRHTLQVVHTPGHAANHLCLILEEDGLLFSATTSSTAAPPSSTRLTATWATTSTRWTSSIACAKSTCCVHPAGPRSCAGRPRRSKDNPGAPEHGGARAAIAQLKAHRLAREAKVATRHAGQARRHHGRLGEDRLRRRARAPVAGGQTLAAGACQSASAAWAGSTSETRTA
jgi:recombination protein RecT